MTMMERVKEELKKNNIWFEYNGNCYILPWRVDERGEPLYIVPDNEDNNLIKVLYVDKEVDTKCIFNGNEGYENLMKTINARWLRYIKETTLILQNIRSYLKKNKIPHGLRYNYGNIKTLTFPWNANIEIRPLSKYKYLVVYSDQNCIQQEMVVDSSIVNYNFYNKLKNDYNKYKKNNTVTVQ